MLIARFGARSVMDKDEARRMKDEVREGKDEDRKSKGAKTTSGNAA